MTLGYREQTLSTESFKLTRNSTVIPSIQYGRLYLHVSLTFIFTYQSLFIDPSSVHCVVYWSDYWSAIIASRGDIDEYSAACRGGGGLASPPSVSGRNSIMQLYCGILMTYANGGHYSARRFIYVYVAEFFVISQYFGRLEMLLFWYFSQINSDFQA